MFYGHRPRASAVSKAVDRGLARAAGMWGGYQAWHRLDPDRRLALVEQTLKPSGDLTDACCAAL